MSFLEAKHEFIITSSVDELEIHAKLQKIVDFSHKSEISTFFIEKEYYGNLINNKVYEIWKKPLISGGLFDKGLAPKVIIKVGTGTVHFFIKDTLLFPVAIFSGIMLLFGIVIFGSLLKDGDNLLEPEVLLTWLPFIIFPLIALLGDRYIYFNLVDSVKGNFTSAVKD